MQRGAEHPFHRARLRYDSHFYLEMSFCNEHGIPHSRFLDWSPDDRSKALAFSLEKSERCSMCGTAEWEWDPAQGGSRRAYEPSQEFCQGCYLKEVAGEGADRMPGTTITLIPTKGRAYAEHVVAVKRRDRG